MKIGIVTDSASDIPDALAQAGNIRVVPCIVVIGNEQFEDGNGLSREEFYRALPDMSPFPTTGAPSIGRFEEAYQQAFDHGCEGVISIHPPSNLSGIINSANAASEKFRDKVKVVDSRQASMGQGYLVLAAAKMALEGLSLKEILNRIEGLKPNVLVIAMLDTLDYLRRSGRVSSLQAGLGSLLSIRAFIELKDGEVSRLDQVRTRKKGIAHLENMIINLPELEDLAVLHSGAEEDATELAGSVADQVGFDPLVINITTIIGTHVGPKGLGCAAVFKN